MGQHELSRHERDVVIGNGLRYIASRIGMIVTDGDVQMLTGLAWEIVEAFDAGRQATAALLEQLKDDPCRKPRTYGCHLLLLISLAGGITEALGWNPDPDSHKVPSPPLTPDAPKAVRDSYDNAVRFTALVAQNRWRDLGRWMMREAGPLLSEEQKAANVSATFWGLYVLHRAALQVADARSIAEAARLN